MKDPFRFWMSGGAAMVLAALSGGARATGWPEERPAHSRVSRYSVAETVSRIEASAVRHGLPVLARLQPGALTRTVRADERRQLVIVLESSQGGTPVAMQGPNDVPALLLSVTVRQGPEGLTEVWFADGAFENPPDGMTPEVCHDLADLPRVVDEALAA